MPPRDRRAQRTPDRRRDSGRASGGRPSKAASAEEGLKKFVPRALARRATGAASLLGQAWRRRCGQLVDAKRQVQKPAPRCSMKDLRLRDPPLYRKLALVDDPPDSGQRDDEKYQEQHQE